MLKEYEIVNKREGKEISLDDFYGIVTMIGALTYTSLSNL